MSPRARHYATKEGGSMCARLRSRQHTLSNDRPTPPHKTTTELRAICRFSSWFDDFSARSCRSPYECTYRTPSKLNTPASNACKTCNANRTSPQASCFFHDRRRARYPGRLGTSGPAVLSVAMIAAHLMAGPRRVPFTERVTFPLWRQSSSLWLSA